MWHGGRDVIPYKCGPISSSLIVGNRGSEVSSLPRNRTAVNRPPTRDGGFPSRPPLDRRRRLPFPFPRRYTSFFSPVIPLGRRHGHGDRLRIQRRRLLLPCRPSRRRRRRSHGTHHPAGPAHRVPQIGAPVR